MESITSTTQELLEYAEKLTEQFGLVQKIKNSREVKPNVNTKTLRTIYYGRGAQRDPNNSYKRRQLGGKVRRLTRLCPDESQMNVFIASFPKHLKVKLVEEIFHVFLEVALEEGLVSTEIIVYIDYTNKFYYGQIGDGSDTAITGTNKVQGQSGLENIAP